MAIPIFECDCVPIFKITRIDSDDPIYRTFECPCCGTSRRLSVFHRLFMEHSRHYDENFRGIGAPRP